MNSKILRGSAFVFPGQGSQKVGMGKALYRDFKSAREVFTLVDEVLSFPLTKVMWEGPLEVLTQTQNAQPAIVAVSMAAFKVLSDEGISPTAVAGHSVGEYAALSACGVLKLEDAIRLVRKRGEYMQEASIKKPSGMAVILGLEIKLIEEICDGLSSSGIIQVANINSPNQIVISGDNLLIEKAMALAKEKGAKRAIRLNVAGAFHSELMREAADLLNSEMEKKEFFEPQFKIYMNSTGEIANSKEELRRALGRQITSKVLWLDIIGNMVKNNISIFVELGEGSVLSGLIKKINSEVRAFNFEDKTSYEELVKNLGERNVVER